MKLLLAGSSAFRIMSSECLHKHSPGYVQHIHHNNHCLEEFTVESDYLDAHTLLVEGVSFYYRDETACDGF